MLRAPSLPARYAEAHLLGRGGMAQVWLARDEVLGREVAIKVLSGPLADDPAARRRFLREARVGARLTGHPHVVAVHDVGSDDETPYIVMEYVPRGSVRDRLAVGSVPTRLALTWLADAASALDAAHDAGIVHRDVKPANLLLTSWDRVKVADFGIARIADPSVTATAPGTLLGTAGYLSPEQARGDPATPASDIYALGVVAYELFAGRRPFERETAAAEVQARLTDPVPLLAPDRRDLPPAIDDILGRALARERRRRYTTATTFVRALAAAFAERPSSERTTVVVPAGGASARPAAGGPPPSSRRRWLIPGILAALLALAGVAAAAAVLRSGDGVRTGAAAAPTLSTTSTGSATAPAGTTAVAPAVTVTAVTTAPPPPPRTVVSTVAASAPPKTVVTTVAAPAPPATTVTPATTPAGGSPASAAPHADNDRGYRLMGAGRYAEALPLLRGAVAALRGTGPGDPYEAYANYNLGYSLLRLGRCAEAIGPLQVADRLERRHEVKQALKEAERCR